MYGNLNLFSRLIVAGYIYICSHSIFPSEYRFSQLYDCYTLYIVSHESYTSQACKYTVVNTIRSHSFL